MLVSNENDKGEGELVLSAEVAVVLAIAGIACAAYGLKFVFSATKMRFHYFWFALAVVLLAPAVLMVAGLWEAIPVALHWVVGAALVLFVVYELFVGVGIARHYRDKATAGLDYVVVLGAQVLEGKPGRTFVRRLDVAYEYLCDNAQTRCIVCGAQGSNESVPEAHAGRAYLVERGIADNRILLEEHSFSTAQNLRNAAKLVDPARDSIGIVTNDYHLGRSLALARKAGMEHACGIAVRSYERFPLNNIVRESIAWAKDVFSGNA